VSETMKVIRRLREFNPKALIRLAGNGDLKIREDTVENVRVNLFYLLFDLAIDLGVGIDREKLEKEIFGDKEVKDAV